MQSSALEDDIVECVLNDFRRTLRGLQGGWLSRVVMGVAPTEGDARRLSEFDASGRMS